MTKPTFWQGVRCIAILLALQALVWALDIWL